MTANSAYSNTSSATTLPAPPAAVIVPSVLAGPAPLAVEFDGSDSYDPDGSIVSWDWSFGDGGGASGAIANHTYLAPGVYYATLYVTSNDGAQANDSVWIEAKGVAPATDCGEAGGNGSMLLLSKAGGDVVQDDYFEGRYGKSSSGADIPAGPTRCYPLATATRCP